jgi:hypothetical protein
MAQREFSMRLPGLWGWCRAQAIIPQEDSGSRLTGGTGGALVTWVPGPLIKANKVEAGIRIVGESELCSEENSRGLR